MKSVLDKARNVLGSYVRAGTERGGAEKDGPQVELHNVPKSIINRASGGLPSAASEGDDILFSKNNVLLKCPATDVGSSVDIQCTHTRLVASTCTLDPTSLSPFSNSLDNHILVPGFLFVTTRGSNFGTTLILNWAPNSSMKVPGVPDTPDEAAKLCTSATSSHIHSAVSGGDQYKCTSQFSSALSIDLYLMEIIRIFYHIDDKGFIVSGELVLKSKDEEFKVFYFSNGGLNELIHIFRSWTFFNHTCHKDTHCHTFTVVCPKLNLSELHPLEGKVSSLTQEVWMSMKDPEGRILDSEYVRKVVFFHGVISSLRKELWPLLLDVYPFSNSYDERGKNRQISFDKYWEIDSERKKVCSSLNKDEVLKWDVLKTQIHKDVLRTDRLIVYYKDENNKHLSILLNILLNYLKYKPDMSYIQGMSDLLAPLLYTVDDEVAAFWCFTKLMETSTLCKPGKNQVSIRHQLELLRLLTEMLIPSFHHYLENVDNGLSLMFCHRWLLVFLKREFNITDILFIWEICWSCIETRYFHLFICVAIMAMYGQKPMDRQMNIDELMVYFNTLSLQMPRDVVLSQARGYLYKFCQYPSVNCALHELMDNDFWHNSSSPKLFCSICKGFGSCSRTGYLSVEEMRC